MFLQHSPATCPNYMPQIHASTTCPSCVTKLLLDFYFLCSGSRQFGQVTVSGIAKGGERCDCLRRNFFLLLLPLEIWVLIGIFYHGVLN